MNIILLSGGSGKRLWPLSNDTRSKQFLKVLKSDSGHLESMVQRVYRQIREAGIDANIVVATGQSQVDQIKSHLGDLVDVITEPERRDTFPAIALSSMFLALKKKMDPDEVVIVLPVDPYANAEYFNTLVYMEDVVRRDLANIVLMGIKPTYASAKYGYIIPSSSSILSDGVANVDYFIEKPSEEKAASLIKSGGMWNGGVFAFKLGYIQSIINKYIKVETYEDACRQFCSLPKISFDYEVIEKESSIGMVVYGGTWKDLGTWNTLTEVMAEETNGNVLVSESCQNTHVINELDIPVLVMGMKDVVIAASPDGFLVSDKVESAQIKPFVETITRRPMYEERRWGEYKVLEHHVHSDGIQSLTKHLRISSGSSISYQTHCSRDEVWTVVEGSGELLINGEVSHISRGDVIQISRKTKHAVRANTDLYIIEVQIGEDLIENDIERYAWDWSESRILIHEDEEKI